MAESPNGSDNSDESSGNANGWVILTLLAWMGFWLICWLWSWRDFKDESEPSS